MSKQYVLDSWALLALLQGEEPAAARVKQILLEGERQQASLLISTVNLWAKCIIASAGAAAARQPWIH
jgi:PIN domain nuclease of toxin-antitoxin system